MTDESELLKQAASAQSGAASSESAPALGTSGSGPENSVNYKEEEIFDFLSRNENIFFKSQQIDDPDLTANEKKEIAKGIFKDSHITFLSRFGRYLPVEHLGYFERSPYTAEEAYEVNFLLKELKQDLRNKEKNVKNRRYAAIQKMLKEEDYFSEKEMMRREPHLYEELVGQYLTATEKKLRDGYDPKNTLFSQILLDTIDKKRTEDLRKKQENDDISDNTSQTSQTTSKTGELPEEGLYPETPPSYRKQWGNFEDEEPSSRPPKKDKSQQYITAGEREMLRQEFIGIMHTKFLEGMDKDFDYSKVDDNPDLDDLNQINQDREDRYFENDEDEEEDRVIRMDDEDGSQDDLDVFMRHLRRNPTFQNQNPM